MDAAAGSGRQGVEMNQIKPGAPRPDTDPRAGDGPAVLHSADLLSGAREVLIRHGDDTYRLKLTGSNKLILTK
jgi:hemin uptake protein HemP